MTPSELAARGLLDVFATAAARHGLTVSEVCGARRLQPFVDARRDVYVELRSRGFSYPAIGRIVGRDHTTVISALMQPARGLCKTSVKLAATRPAPTRVTKEVA